MTYEIPDGLCPDNLHHKFVERSMISEYGTKNHRELRFPNGRLEYAKKVFTSRVSKIGMKFMTTSGTRASPLLYNAS